MNELVSLATPWGEFTATLLPDGRLSTLDFPQNGPLLKSGPTALSQALTHYLAESVPLPAWPLYTSGTPFQERVWQALLTVPFGGSLSYQGLAALVGNPKAAQAVGGALGANPIPLFIPCHRILSRDNRIGGYASGTDIKRRLLQLEGIRVRD